MSLFGSADDDDRRIWQQRNLKGLTELVQLGAQLKLPPLFWTLPDIGTVCGKVDAYTREQHPREAFEAWYAALSKHRRVDPRRFGLRGDGPSRSERGDNSGKTRLMAAFTLRLTDQRSPKVDITIIAEWFEDNVTNEPSDAEAVTR